MSSVVWQILFGVVIIIFSIGFIVRFTSLIIIMHRHQREERIGVQEVEGIRMESVSDNPILVSDANVSHHNDDLELGSASFDGEDASAALTEPPTAHTSRRIVRVEEVVPLAGDADFMPVVLVSAR